MKEQTQHNETEVDRKAEQLLERHKRRPRRLSGWKLALVITSILVVGVTALVAVFALTLFKNPMFQEAMAQYRVMVECEDNLSQIGGALNRYSRSADEFPEKLEDLIPDYLESDSLFRCPADSKDSTTSYSYKRPKLSAPDDTIMCACPRHRVMKNQPPLIVELRKDGKVTHRAIKETR